MPIEKDRDWLRCLPYHVGSKLQVWLLGNIGKAYDLLGLMDKKHVVIVSIRNNMSARDLFRLANKFRIKNFQVFPDNIVIMANTPPQLIWARQAGFRAIYVNSNCFLDESIFHIREEDKNFGALLNAEPLKWKRTWLAKRIPDLALLRHRSLDRSPERAFPGLDFKFCNSVKLSRKQVSKFCNRSWVGLALSGNTGLCAQGHYEGACRASGEYLLCGIPVVSTPSEGGRDIWYNEHNSVIVDPDVDSVFKGWKQVKERILRGEISPQQIRNQHLVMMRYFRANFIRETARIFAQAGLSIDAESYFRERFVCDMLVKMAKRDIRATMFNSGEIDE